MRLRGGLPAALVSLGMIAPLFAQFGGAPPDVPYQNAPYNGRLTFARLRFTPARWGPGNYEWGLDLGWNHDYPRSDNHFMKILKETTSLEVNLQPVILKLDEDELFRYPLAYVCEPGFWTLSDKEAAALGAYLRKGGFLIVDDFMMRDLTNLEDVMRRALPEARFQEIPMTHPVWDSFFKIDEPPRTHPYRRFLSASYLGIFEDNDPGKRLLAIANHNNDISEYWEWSDTGMLPIDLSNEAYKLGVNYVIYALTH